MRSFFTFLYWVIFKSSKYSQSNEEELLLDIFKEKPYGFYVDLGCHHPMRFSNTAMLYKIGWRGINIDANKSNIKLFNVFRRRDINISALVSEHIEKHKYYYFKDGALNGILSNSRVEFLESLNYVNIRSENILTTTLNDLLSNYDIPNKAIDLLNIDIEGHDFQALKSIDLNYYNVKVILIETGQDHNDIKRYLDKFNYRLHKKVDRNSFFIKS
jgi:hypothetical protein